MQFVTRRRRIVGGRSLLLSQGEGSRRRCRYTDRPLSDGSTKNRPLAVDFDRRRSISTADGRLSKKKARRRRRGKKRKRKEEEKKDLAPARHPHSRVVAARGSWALFLPRGEKD
ncbi:hypothetical protein GW17_00016386 [Ensete ventricosum]|nr:hypothetical protein GW17_00016386 [Ensete ventricosum]RZS25948.1 hypothetical protein BHM03_00059222 [Ensete ventricosum]